MTTVSYLHNLRYDFERWTEGAKPGDTFCVVDSCDVDSNNPEVAAELAFRHFQRLDVANTLLDAHEAPSMSVGDAALVKVDDAPPVVVACRTVGWEAVEHDVIIAERAGLSVRQLADAWTRTQ